MSEEEIRQGEAAESAQPEEIEISEAEAQESCCREEGEQEGCCRHGEHENGEHCCRHEGEEKKDERHCKHEKMKAELAKAQAEAADFKDKWMRTAAEFDNFRKRNESTRRSAYNDGKADMIVKILPVGDNLERALLTCDEQTKKGIEMVLRSFKKLLDDEGIEPIDPKDEEFDPTFCEAIMSEPAADGVEPGYVKEVFLKGYKKGDKVIRYAQVKVTT